jgi:hypothetical protein
MQPEFVQDALIAEAHTLKKGILLAESLGCKYATELSLLSDCMSMNVVDTMRNGAGTT